MISNDHKNDIKPQKKSFEIERDKLSLTSNGETEKDPCPKRICEGCHMTNSGVFLSGGRFCSKRCIGKYAVLSKQRNIYGVIKDVLSSNQDETLSKIDCSAYAAYIRGVNGTTPLISSFNKSQRFYGMNKGIKLGMRLEGINPNHQYLYVVLSVAKVQGARLWLQIDGFSAIHNFWVNLDSSYIFPIGWCKQHNKSLTPPPSYEGKTFDWSTYLDDNCFMAMPAVYFSCTYEKVTSQFSVGHKLETVDPLNLDLTCVSTIRDTLYDKILVHFDGWSDAYDFWCDATSPYIHPVGWCEQNNIALSPPKDFGDADKKFSWEQYLLSCDTKPVPKHLFHMKKSTKFKIGDFLEAIDLRNPILLRISRIIEIKKYLMKIHYEGWPNIYDTWIEDGSPNLHPLNWAQKTGHPLENPFGTSDDSSCPTPHCRGRGSFKGINTDYHVLSSECPYSSENMEVNALESRLKAEEKILKNSAGSTKSMNVDNSSNNCDNNDPVTSDGVGGGVIVNEVKSATAEKPLFGPGSGRGRKKNTVLMERANLTQKDIDGYSISKKTRRVKNQGEIDQSPHSEGSTHNEQRCNVREVNGHGDGDEDGDGDSGCSDNTRVRNQVLTFVHNSLFTPARRNDHYAIQRPTSTPWAARYSNILNLDHSDISNSSDWSVEQVVSHVERVLKTKQYSQIFRDVMIDGQAFTLLQMNDLRNILKLKLGPSIKIFASIDVLRQRRVEESYKKFYDIN